MNNEKLIEQLEGLLHTYLDIPLTTDRHFGEISGLEKAIELLKQQPDPWISVEDRLPKLTQDSGDGMQSVAVLCRHIDGHHEDCVCHEDIDGGDPYWYYVQDGEYCETVTHWMPLPEPPKPCHYLNHLNSKL